MSAVLTLTHDEMAIRAATQMRDLAVKGQTPWSRVFGSDIVITSSSDWPEPDFVFSDPSTRITFGFEFKPPGQERRECLTGLGQGKASLSSTFWAFWMDQSMIRSARRQRDTNELVDGFLLRSG